MAARIESIFIVLLIGGTLLFLTCSTQCVDSASLLSCDDASDRSSATIRTINSICTGCCSAQANTTSAVVCNTRALGTSGVALTTTSRCLGDGTFVTCPNYETNGSASVTAQASLVTGACLQTSSCVAPCNVFSALGRLRCESLGIAINSTQCAWSYGNTPSAVGCVPYVSVMRGACISDAGRRSCNNHSVAALCCPLAFDPSRSSSASASHSRALTSATNTTSTSASRRTRSRTRSLPSVSPSPSTSGSPSSTRLTQSVGDTTHSPTGSDTVTGSPSLSVSRPSGSSTLETLTFRHTTTSEQTFSDTIPSPTQRASATQSIRISITPEAAIVPTRVGSTTIAQEAIAFRIRLNRSVWRLETIPFLDQSMHGTQSWSPFGFDAQKEVVFGSVAIVPGSDLRELIVQLRQDQCYDARRNEDVRIVISPDYYRALNASQLLDPDVHMVVGFTIAEDPAHSERRMAGLAISIVVAIALVVSGLLGNPGVSLLTFCEFQLTIIIAQQSCSRGQVAAYFEDAFWVVTPTLTSPAFEDVDPQFGVVLVHFVVVMLFFAIFVAASRLRKRIRMYFPSLPLGIVYVLFIGATNSAWRSAIHSQKPGPATASMVLWVLYFLAVAATVWRIRSPRGLLFLRYRRGVLSNVLRGTHSPLQLRGKYSLMIDLWHEDYVQFASPVHLAHLSLSSILSALSSDTTLLCFPVLGLQLSWQALIVVMTVFARPGRSPFHNGLLVLHALSPIAIIVAQLSALDCLKVRNFTGSEVLTILSLTAYVVSAVLQAVVSVVERRYRADVERELQDITAKHRRIVFFLDDTASAKGQGDKLPPISRHQVPQKLVDPDWRSKRHQETFSFPLSKAELVEGDAWSTAATGGGAPATRRRSYRSLFANGAGGGGGAYGWTHHHAVERDGDDDSDEDDMDLLKLHVDPTADPQEAGGDDAPNERGGRRAGEAASPSSAAATGGPQWVSTRYEHAALHRSVGGGGGTRPTPLRPLSSQVQLFPSSHGAQQPVLRRQVPLELPLTASDAPPDGGGLGHEETVSRCHTCHRWIVLQEGCPSCSGVL